MNSKPNNTRRDTSVVRCGLAVFFALAMGCAGDGHSEALEANLYDVGDYREAVAFPVVDDVVWQVAPAGCEGLLSAVHEFGIAAGEPELIVGFRGASVVCVDTYASVERELDETEPAEVGSLWLGYVAALQNLESTDGRAEGMGEEMNGGDMQPRINTDIELDISYVMGDPTPQPNITGIDVTIAQGDPTPQPNKPNEETPPSPAD